MTGAAGRGPEDDDGHLDETIADAEPVGQDDELDLGEGEPDDADPADEVAVDDEAEEPDPVDGAEEPDPLDEADESVDLDDPADLAEADEPADLDEPAAVDEVEDAEPDPVDEHDPVDGTADEPDDDAPPAHAVDADADDDRDEVEDERTRSAVAAALAGDAVAGGVTSDGPDGPDGPMSDADADTGGEDRSHRGRWVLLGVAAVLGALYVAGFFLTGARMPADASIGGVDVGGMSPAEARSAVERGLAPRAGEPVVLTHRDDEFTIDPADVDLALDPDASVEQAGGTRSWHPRDMLALFVGSHEHAPVVTADEDALESAVNAVSEEVDVPVTEALITFPKSEPKARAPKAGLVVRKADAARTVREEYLVQDEPVPVPTAEVEPAVDEEGLRRAMTEIAEPAVSAPVTIEVGDKEVELPVTAYAPALTVEPVDGAMAPVIDAEKLAKPLTDATTGIGRKAVDATVEIRDGKPVVVPGKEGVGLQPQEMAEKLVPVLTESGDARAVQVEAKVVEPQFTTEDAKNLRITEKISEFTTQYPHAEYRNVNQSRAAELIDGTIIEPGETFSFNDTVGERTAANGFTTGSVINNGRFQDELGGGVSQVVTTTYNAAFFAGLEDVEHHPHAFYIDRYPVGREATVYYGSLDLRFRNNLKSGVLIRAFVQKSAPGGVGRTTVQMWGTKQYDVEAGQSARRNFRAPATRYDDSADCVPQAPLQGFDIDIYRTISQGGKVVKRETDTANYQAADRIVCGEEPRDE